MILPVLSFGVYNVLIFVPAAQAVLAAKVVENSTDYSLNNTVRQHAVPAVHPEQKFSAKQAIDSFFVRMGRRALGGARLRRHGRAGARDHGLRGHQRRARGGLGWRWRGRWGAPTAG